MADRQSDQDASNIFWPGYVDAVSNLVLNLLFLLTIMTIAVFMFALEFGRASYNPTESMEKKAAGTVNDASKDPTAENMVLKREIERLNLELALANLGHGGGLPKPSKVVSQQPDALHGLEKTLASDSQMVDTMSRVEKQVDGTDKKLAGNTEIVAVSAGVPKPLAGLDKALGGNLEIVVNFTDEAVGFTPAEEAQLLEALQPIAASGKAIISVEVPPGFSEARRMGFYRVMAVRNLLIEMAMPNENIEVLVRDGKGNANASIVRVR